MTVLGKNRRLQTGTPYELASGCVPENLMAYTGEDDSSCLQKGVLCPLEPIPLKERQEVVTISD